MTVPASIFKYEPFTVQSLKNLKTQTIYFGPPKNFNDPYDCAITASIRSLSANELDKVKNHLLTDGEMSSSQKQELENTDPSKLAEILESIIARLVDSERHGLLVSKGVSCFSETNDNLLMWSHYANRCRGFCLEFDTRREPFHKLRKVIYQDTMPEIDPLPMMLKNDYTQMVDLFCTKSQHWSYEREWRAIHKHAGTAYTYKKETLKAIYFGPDIEDSERDIISTIVYCEHPEVKLFRGHRSTTEFKVEFQQFSYIPNILVELLGNRKDV